MLGGYLTLALSALVAGAPRDPSPLPMCKPSMGVPGAAYVCMGQNFLPKESCSWMAPRGTKCMTFPFVDQRPLSVGPDPGTTCALYESKDCSGEPLKMGGSGFHFT
jgi:hypothetical protein